MVRHGERLATLESELRQAKKELELLWQRHRDRGVRIEALESIVAELRRWKRRATSVVLFAGTELFSGVWGQLLREAVKRLAQ